MITPEEYKKRLEENDIMTLLDKPVYASVFDGWATVGRLICVTPDTYVLKEVSRVALDGKHSEFAAGNILETAEIESWPPEQRMWIPICGAPLHEWGGKLPLETQ